MNRVADGGGTAPPRGKLKIFLGYAAGVGKTHAMLEAARQRLDEGVDVVVGYVDTHGRAEMQALVESLESIPPRQFEASGAIQREMNIDALLARRPQLVLVDELAHANAPGARHARRYQDVEELLAAGIDVYATLNIQNLESLNDVVVQITGVTVRDTVPDRIMDGIDSLELVDLPPDELIRRLHEGKVAVPDQTAQAMQKFFRPGNLTALREMALRHTAAQVDDQMRAYKKAHAIFNPWAATDRLLVCISANPLSERLVRAGRRLADQLDVEWFVLYVETPGYGSLPEDARDRVARTLHLAEDLGGRSVTIPGQDVAEAILDYSRSHNVTKIIVGKSLEPRWRELFRGSIVDRIIHNSDQIDVYVISARATRVSAVPRLVPRPNQGWQGYLVSAGLVIAVTLAGLPIRAAIAPTNLVMLYLLAVVIAATRWGRGPSVVSAVLSVLFFDFFLVPPYLTFRVSDAQYLLTFIGLLVVGLVVSTLAAREREQAEMIQRRETYTAALYALSRDLASTVDLGAIIQTVIKHISELFHCNSAIFLPQADTLALRACSPGFPIDDEGYAAANWVFQHGRVAGQGTGTLSGTGARYLPLETAQSVIGVVGVRLVNEFQVLSPDQERLLEALLRQVALAVEATQLAEKAGQAHLLREQEKLQTALLNSISHDLRTPLSSITGALSSLRDDATYLDDAARQDLIDTAWEEAGRLNYLVANLLSMTRLEAGVMRLSPDLCDVQDLIGVALSQMTNRLRGRTVDVDAPQSLPPVPVDLVLAAQALVNVIDNAVKYSPAHTAIGIRARHDRDEVVIEVADRGPGIHPDELQSVFEKFYRLQQVSDTTGVGLGLSIAKGIIELHGGRIWAANRDGGGAVVSIALPAHKAGATDG